MKQTRRTLKKRFREPDPAPVLRIICATLGPGKARLLQAIDVCGSLSQAAREMALTYRQAWMMLAEMNAAFHEELTESFTGGVRGGGMRLTATGRTVLELYQEIQAQCERVAEDSVRTLHTLLK
jgi:molybdate transport system regulatory protein